MRVTSLTTTRFYVKCSAPVVGAGSTTITVTVCCSEYAPMTAPRTAATSTTYVQFTARPDMDWDTAPTEAFTVRHWITAAASGGDDTDRDADEVYSEHCCSRAVMQYLFV